MPVAPATAVTLDLSFRGPSDLRSTWDHFTASYTPPRSTTSQTPSGVRSEAAARLWESVPLFHLIKGRFPDPPGSTSYPEGKLQQEFPIPNEPGARPNEPGATYVASTMARAGSDLYIGQSYLDQGQSRRSRLLAMDASTGSVRWIKRFESDCADRPIPFRDVVLVGCRGVLAVDIRTGEERWRQENAGGQIAVSASGALFVAGIEGKNGSCGVSIPMTVQSSGSVERGIGSGP